MEFRGKLSEGLFHDLEKERSVTYFRVLSASIATGILVLLLARGTSGKDMYSPGGQRSSALCLLPF